jgi:hypothetical protein
MGRVCSRGMLEEECIPGIGRNTRKKKEHYEGLDLDGKVILTCV